MDSRMSKYYEDETPKIGSRAKRNQNLYEEMYQDDLKNVNLASNAKVIGDSDSNVDIDKIKEILETKYPKKRHTPILEDYEEEEQVVPKKEETKEYDINALLEKAKQNQVVDYEKDRLKKVHDTQYDILKGLETEEESSKDNEDDLMDLISAINEKEETQVNPLDILTDLKGSDNTVVLEGMKDDLEKEVKKEDVNKEKEEPKKEIDKTFYTNSLTFTKSDFDDFNDLKEDVKSNKILIRILIFIIVVALIVGIVFLVNQIFNLNLF